MGLITSKIRLYVEYGVLALLLVVAGLAVTLKMQTLRQETSINNLQTGLDTAKGRIQVVEGVNAAQDGVIKTVTNQRVADNDAVTKLLDTYQKLREADSLIRSKLDNLEKNDAQAKAYLAGAVPDSVGCLYDDSCPDPTSSRKDGDSKADSTNGPVTNLLLAPEEKALNSMGGHGSIPRLEKGGK